LIRTGRLPNSSPPLFCRPTIPGLRRSGRNRQKIFVGLSLKQSVAQLFLYAPNDGHSICSRPESEVSMKRIIANLVRLLLGACLYWNFLGVSVARADEWTWTPKIPLPLTPPPNYDWSEPASWYSTADNSTNAYAPTNDGSADIVFTNIAATLSNQSIVDSNWAINSLSFVAGPTFVLSGSGQLIVGAGGITTSNSSPGPTILNSILLAAPQSWMATSTLSMTIDGPVNINSQKLTLDGGGAININGPITGSGQFILNGAGSVTFGGGAANTFSSPIQVNNGTLYLNKPNAVNAVAGDLIIGDGVSSAFGVVQLENSNQISDSHTVTINSNGALVIPNGTQDYIPTLVLNGGEVITGTGPGCFLGFINNSGFIQTNASPTLALISGVLNLNDDSSHTTTFNVVPGTTSSGIDLWIDALVVAGGITKYGTGTMVLTNSNTFAGGVNLNGGRIFVENNTAGNSGSVTSGPLGTGTLTMSDQTTLEAYAGNFTLANAVNIPTAGTSGIIDGPSNLTLTGTLTGNGGLVKNGTGTLTFTLATNRSIGGGLTVNNGSVVLNALGGGLTIGGNLAIGAISGQTATLTVNNGTLLQNGGTTIVGATGSGAATVNIGTTASGSTLTVGSSGLIINPTGAVHIGSGSTSGTLDLTNNGNVLVNGGTLEIDGGSVKLPFFPENGIRLQNGATMTTAVSIPATINGDSTSTINITGNNVSLGTSNGSVFLGFNFLGVLNNNAHTLTLNSNGYAQLGSFTYLNTGTINAPNGLSLPSGSWLEGGGNVNGRVVGQPGAIISVPLGQSFQLGDSSSPAGFNFGGELQVGLGTMTLFSSGPATLGNLTTIDSGTLNAANGFVLNFGDAITGQGTINSSNTLALHSVINGIVQGTSPSQPVTLSGWIKGTGTLNNVSFAPGATYDPGFSPATVNVGSIAFSTGSTLNIDIGGTSPGSQYDQIVSSGTPTLAGTLNLSPYGGFVPVAGDKFTVMTYSSASGTFSAVTGTSAGPGLTYSAVYLPTSLVILTTTNGEKTWGVDASGNSSLGSNWIGGVAPAGVGDTATFSTIITAPKTVTVDTDATVGTLKFDSPISYTIAGPHTLTLQAAGASAASINVLNTHGNGAHTISAPLALASDLNIAQNSSGTLRIAGPLNDAAAHAINKSGTGVAEIDGVPTFGAGTNLSVTAGTLRFALASGAATVGTGVQATVNGAATLELAGAASALSSGIHRTNVLDNSSAAAGLLVSGTNQQVGFIDGSGTTQVNADSDLTASHIIQTALVIGGTASNRGTVTIDASDAAGNPLTLVPADGLGEQNSAGSNLADSLSPSGPFAADNISPTAPIGIAADGSNLVAPATGNSAPAGSSPSVPEPSTLLLTLLAALAYRSRRQPC
jgi:fibronectin-binding autotransporter adhesin